MGATRTSQARTGETLRGNAQATLTVRGASQRVSGNITFVVDEDGTVVSDPGSRYTGHGMVTGNRMVLHLGANYINAPGITCRGSFRLAGTISRDRLAGVIMDNEASCNGVPIKVDGGFNTRRVVQARRVSGTPALAELGHRLRHVVR